MKCWHCNSEVIWGGDHDNEDYGRDGDGIVSNLSCSNCSAFYLCYLDSLVCQAIKRLVEGVKYLLQIVAYFLSEIYTTRHFYGL